MKVRRGVDILNRPLAEIASPSDPFHITAVKRGGATLIPHGNDCLEEDDLVFVMTTPSHVNFVRELLGKAHGPETHCVFYMGAADTVIHSINTLPHPYRRRNAFRWNAFCRIVRAHASLLRRLP